jgi:hypothetical protein
VVVRNHQLYAVEDFASTVKSLDLNEQESIVANILAQSGLQIANNKSVSVEDARRTCTMSTGYAGHRQPWYIIRYNADKLSELPSQLQSHLNSGTYHQAAVGACVSTDSGSFTAYGVAILLYP